MNRYCLSNSKVMKELCKIYIINNYDIFNFKASHSNIITYHHLIEVDELKALEFSTKKTFLNGLSLTRIGHSLLHLIEDFAPDIFLHLNKIILLITKEQRLPTEEERNLIYILVEAFFYRMYTIDYKISAEYLTRSREINKN